MGPEDIADELDRLARILTVDDSQKLEPLPDWERNEYQHRIDALLSERGVRAAIVCANRDTRLFLEGYTEGVDAYAPLRSLIEQLL